MSFADIKDIAAWVSLVTVLSGAIIAYFRFRTDMVLLNPKVLIDLQAVVTELQSENRNLRIDLDKEHDRRREQVNGLDEKYSKQQVQLTNYTNELAKQKAVIDHQATEIQKLKQDLMVSADTIEYLVAGVFQLIQQIAEIDGSIKPNFIPKITLRGKDDDSANYITSDEKK